MEKDWYDKYNKEFHCADCTFLDSCLNKDAPLHSKCYEQYLKDRIVELEAKLAEKDKEIEKLNAMINTLPAHDKELEEIHNQNKISFAVEQLEKVKAELERLPCVPKYNKTHELIDRTDIRKYIDNQINVLRNIKEE